MDKKYIKYKTKYFNLLNKLNIYEQYGGKIYTDSLKIGLNDFSNFVKHFKLKPGNQNFNSTI